MIYMDYAASAPMDPRAARRMYEVATEAFGNPGAVHRAGNQARRILQDARRSLAKLLNVREQEIFFTSGGTEANNWAVLLGAQRGRHIVAAATEHKSVLEPLRQLEKQGHAVTYIAPDDRGVIRVEAVEKALRPDTGMICVQAINNETGVIQDVDALADLAKKRGIAYFCDAVQSFSHVRQNLHKASYISISAHKFGGPRGVGCLVVRYPHFPEPMIRGGGQELGKRSGTENVAAIAAFALAAELAAAELDRESVRLRALTDYFAEKLKEAAPTLVIHSGRAPRHPGILNCRFPGITGEEMAVRLDLKGICVSPGAACGARDGAPSHVLLAMGQSEQQAKEALRFSLGKLTTREEIEQAAQAVAEIINNKKEG